MQATFDSLLPIFLLILCGNVLRRLGATDDAGWDGVNRLCYWFFYPALIFVTILDADFAGIDLGPLMLALAVALPLMFVLVLALWPPLRNTGLVRHGEFSSIFQTSIRWNGFMALAIAQKLFTQAGMAVIALVMAVIILPINLMTVYVVTRFADRGANWRTVLRRIITNPMVIAAIGGVALRVFPAPSPAIDKTLQLIGQASLGLGLVGIGAGLRPSNLVRLRLAVVIPVIVKLLVFPAVILAVALLVGVSGEPILYLVLCGAMPTAMNGYVLARQMGGDADLYATVTTLQTLVSFATIPLALFVAGQVAGG